MPGADRQALHFVESCYRVADDLDTWLAGLLRAATPMLDRGAGVHAYAYGVDPAGTISLRSSVVETSGTPSGMVARIMPTVLTAPPALVYAMFCRAPALVSSWMRTRELDVPALAGFDPFELLAPFGVRDIVGVSAFDPSGIGLLLSAPSERLRPVSTRALRRWRMLRAHMLAGLRLQSRLAVDEGDAVLSSSGRVLHARGAARTVGAREALRRRAQHINRAHADTRRPLDPDAALAAWRGLVSGTWSLVDEFSRDGRRYFIARRNDPQLSAPSLLSARERQVAAYAALGYSNKLIAYTLGLAPSTVSSHLRRAMRSLRCGTLSELVRAWSYARGHA